jgi:glutathione synthase/RimK-type ligase-like ATP-grasp enzyme
VRFRRIRKHRLVELAAPRLLSVVAPRRAASEIWDDAALVDVAPPFTVAWPEQVARPFVGIVQDGGKKPHWTKYRRFLSENSFDFRVVDIHGSSWTDDLSGVDILVWRPSSRPHELEEARKKIFHMQEFLHVPVYPGLRAVNMYEDKVVQSWVLASLGADAPTTVVSFSEVDAVEQVAALGPEVVWKIATGAGSAGVERLSARRSRAAIRRAFSMRGRRTYWPYLNQKGYVYAQSYEQGLTVDVRVLVVGPVLSGYFRDAPAGDFRASGMGLERRGLMPARAMEEAWRIARSLDAGPLSVDFLSDPGLQVFKVTEMSAFNQIDSPFECQLDGVPGVYIRRGEQAFDFHPGRYWFQELSLAYVLARHCGIDADALLRDAVTKGQLLAAQQSAADR